MINEGLEEDKCCYEHNTWKERYRSFRKTISDIVKSLTKPQLVDDKIMLQTRQTKKNGHDHRRV